MSVRISETDDIEGSMRRENMLITRLNGGILSDECND